MTVNVVQAITAFGEQCPTFAFSFMFIGLREFSKVLLKVSSIAIGSHGVSCVMFYPWKGIRTR